MDAIIFMDDVFVPWERVFLYGDVQLCNNLSPMSGQYNHSGHQVVTKNVAKCEFVVGVANLMVTTLGSESIPQVQTLLAELIENLEIMKALLCISEVNAEIDEWGVMRPALTPITVGRNLFIKMYPRMVEIIQLLGSSSLMALPSEKDFDGPLKEGHHPVPGHGHSDGAGAGGVVPPGMGPVRQRVWIPTGDLRAVLPG